MTGAYWIKDRYRYLPSGAQFDAFYNAAEEHQKQRRYRDALYNYDRALDIKPNNDIVWLRKANVFLAMGRFEDALVACKRASELRPGDSTTWYLMGLAYNQLGDFEKELKAYDTALKISPRMEAALLNKGATLFQLHRYDWALKVYDDMCRFFPNDAMAFNNRGIVLKAMGRHKEALESFEKALFLNRDYIDPAVNRALTLIEMGRIGEAIEAWNEALQIDRRRADIWYSLGMAQKSMGQLEDATKSFETAAMLDKGLTEAATERDELMAAARMAKTVPEPESVEVPEQVPQSIEEAAASEVSQTERSPLLEPVEVETTPVQPEELPEQPLVTKSVLEIVETGTTEKQEQSPIPEPVEVEATTIHSEEIPPEKAQTVGSLPEVLETETTEGQISSPISELTEVETTPVQPEESPEQPQVAETVPEVAESEKEGPSSSTVSESEVEAISLGSEERSSEPPQAAEPILEVIGVEKTGEQAESPVPEAQVDTIQPEVHGPMEVQKTGPVPEVVETETAEESVPELEQEPEPVESMPLSPEGTTPEGQNLIEPSVTEAEHTDVPEEVPEIEPEEPSPEQEESLAEPSGSEVPLVEGSVEEVPLEASGMAEETATTLDLPSDPARKEGEPRALVLIDEDVQISVRESTCMEVQKIGDINAVIPAEQACVPAVIDDKYQLSITVEHGLPALVDVETAMAVPSSESRSLSSVEAEKEGVRAPAAEISAIEAIPLVVQSPPRTDGVVIVPEPLIEVPLEPEIPISDRELKAAIILNILGENARALDEISRYIREKSGSHDARHIKAIILDDMGRLTECLEELKEAIQLDPRDEIALMDIESISRRLGRREESMRILASISPSKEVRAREATNMLESKRYDEIVAKFSSPGPLDTPVIKMAAATSLMVQGRYREGYRVLKEILLEHPTYPEALNNMGVCMRFMGEYAYDEPMHFMKLAVEADPNYGDAWNNIGATLFVLGEYDAAMEAIRKAVAVDRRSDYLVNLSKCQVMLGDIAGAKLSLTSALKYEETAEIDFALGMIAEKEGDLKWALKLYDSAIELVPNFKDAIFNRQRVRLFLKYTQT